MMFGIESQADDDDDPFVFSFLRCTRMAYLLLRDTGFFVFCVVRANNNSIAQTDWGKTLYCTSLSRRVNPCGYTAYLSRVVL